MSLTSALNTAQSILSNTSTQTSVVARNIANVGNPDYARRSAELANNGWGADIVGISRTNDDALFRENIKSISAQSGQDALSKGIERIRSMLGGNDYENAPSSLIGQFRDSLQLFAARPGDLSTAQSAISEAADVTDGLRDMSIALQAYRKDTDSEIDRQVGELNQLLSEFKTANDAVKRQTSTGGDASDALDTRDRLLRGISEIVGINTVKRGSNDLAIYTKDGATLFETIPREVSFQPTTTFDAATVGNSIFIDGVPVEPGAGGSTTAQGSLAGLLQVRDDIAPTFQAQLDETARGLAAAIPDLFQVSVAGDPANAQVMPGAAFSLTVNPALVSASGGDPMMLRDGIGYADNPTMATGYTERLEGHLAALQAPMAFDGSAMAGDGNDLVSYAAASVGWLETVRQQADQALENKSAAYFRSTETLSNTVGVNLDEEMAKLIDLEQSYKASARLMSVVDEMFNNLLASVR